MQSNIITDLFTDLFKNPNNVPTSCNPNVTLDEKKILFLALAFSQICYFLRDVDFKNKFKTYISNLCPGILCNLEYYAKKGNQEYITGTCGEFAIIAFTGTENPFLYFNESMKDVIADFTTASTIIAGTKFQIHKGFLDSANSVYTDILNIFKIYKSQNKKIIITGHSKGGAVAQVISLLLKFNNNLIPDFLITFASARPFFNKDPVTYMETYFLDRTVHVDAEYDPVTVYPISYSNACPRQILKVNSYTNFPVLAHSLNNYLYGLNLKYGCMNKNNICGCAKNLDKFPLAPGGGNPSKYVPTLKGSCPY